MASVITNAGALGIANGTISYSSDTIKARLCVAGTINVDNTSMTGHTAAATAADLTLASKAVAKDDALDVVKFTAASPLTFTGLTGGAQTATHIAIFKFVTDDAGSTPIAYIDIADQALSGATQATYTMDTNLGYFYLDTVA